MQSDDLSNAAAAYCQVFGHRVPAEVLQLFVQRPGPLVMEIRQAIALRKPVPAWVVRSRTPAVTAATPWSPGA